MFIDTKDDSYLKNNSVKTNQPRKRDDKMLENSCTVEGRKLGLDFSKVYEELLPCLTFRVYICIDAFLERQNLNGGLNMC